MLVLGIIFGVADIIFGIIVLFNAQSSPIFIGAGIGYIISGFLFIWLCSGAAQAFKNETKIKEIDWRLRGEEAKNKAVISLLKKKGVSDDEIDKELESSVYTIKEGAKLVALVEKRTPDYSIVVPVGTEVTFVKINQLDNGYNIETKAEIGGRTITIRYKENEVVTPSKYQEQEQ